MRWGLLTLASLGCSEPDAAPPAGDGLDGLVDLLVDAMSIEEKVAELHGISAVPTDGLYIAGGNERLGIPSLRMSDGPRGVTAGISTTFPVGMARGATFDPALEERVAEAIGLELKAKDGNVILAPVVETLRHPAWGRAQETYGEDPHHLGVMGAAFVRGAQRHVIATPKHLAVNSIEDTRFDVDVTVDERSLRELYLSPHKVVVDAGAGAIMSAYNSVNGAFCAENEVLLRQILKEEWGFQGFVMSDWIWGTHDTLGMAAAGLDVEMPAPQYYGPALVDAVTSGAVDEARVDESVRRVVRTKLAFGLHDPEPVELAVVESPEHVALALEVARGSMVLLKDDGALPLSDAGSIAVLGRLADVANLGDAGSSDVSPSAAVDPLAGIEAAAGRHGISVVHAADAPGTVGSDVAVVVVGLTADDEGEQIPLLPGGDRESLALRAVDTSLIAEVAAVHPRVVVVVEGGSAVLVDPWLDTVEGLVMAWYPGMEGGTALGELLLGEVPFSGRLPLTFPAVAADLPPFDHVSHAVTYDYWHGYRHLDREGTAPRFAFGFGLTGTTFAYEALDVRREDGGIVAEVELVNTGDARGAEVVQLYLGVEAEEERAPRDLRAFEKVWLDAGGRATVELTVPAEALQVWSTAQGGWVTPPGPWTVEVGSDHRTLPLSAEVI